MSAPSGSELQAGWGFETADKMYAGYDGTSGINNFLRVRSLTGVHARRPYERNDNLDPARQTVKGINAKADVMLKASLRPDVDSIVRLLAHVDRKYAITDLTDAHQWDLEPWRRGDSEPASYIDSMSWEIDTGDTKPVLHFGCRIPGWNLKIAENKIHDLSFDILGCHDTYLGDVEEVSVNAAFTGRVITWGHRSDPTSSDALKCKVTTASTGGTGGKVAFTKGATAYGATEYDVTFGTPIAVRLADGSKAGHSRFEEVYVLFLDPDGDAELTLNDEWTIAASRTAATASYSTRNVLHGAGVTVTLGGTEYALHNVEVRCSNPLVPSFKLGSKYAHTIQRNGRRSMSFVFDRDAEDRDLLNKIIAASSFGVVVTCYGDPIGSTAYDDQWKITASNCQVSSLTRDVTTENTLPEKIEVEAHMSGSTDMYTQQVICGVATI